MIKVCKKRMQPPVLINQVTSFAVVTMCETNNSNFFTCFVVNSSLYLAHYPFFFSRLLLYAGCPVCLFNLRVIIAPIFGFVPNYKPQVNRGVVVGNV